MSRNTRTLPDLDPTAASARVRAMLALLGIVIVLDQVVKWWAWRHAPGANINAGGDVLVGSTVGRWYANPTTGALLDVLDASLLCVAGVVLVRRPRSAAVLLSGGLMLAGWVSNLLDRLGLHYLTAPGSVRGAVDFHRVGHYNLNVADLFIVVATPLFLLAIGYSRRRNGPRAAATAAPRIRQHPRWVRIPALTAAVFLIAAVTVGAANHGGVTAPAIAASAASYH